MVTVIRIAMDDPQPNPKVFWLWVQFTGQMLVGPSQGLRYGRSHYASSDNYLFADAQAI